MRRIISAVLLIAMLMTTILMVVPASAVNEFTVNSADDFNAVLRAAQVDGTDRTIRINAGTTITPSSLRWPDADVTVTVTGGGTLDLSKVGRVNLGCGLALDNINVVFKNNEYVFANGHPFTITKNATVAYKDGSGNAIKGDGENFGFSIYGGANGGTVNGDTYLNIQSGVFTVIAGGGNGGVVNGNTEVIIGTEGYVNCDDNDTPLVDWVTDEGDKYNVYGGAGTNSVVHGDTSMTIGQYAYIDYVFGGSLEGGKVDGTANTYFSGYAGSVYGANRSSVNGMNDVNLVILGGETRQVYGASSGSSLGSNDDPSNVCVRFLGGDVTRRIYGGCYNTTLSSSCRVYGTISLVLGTAKYSLNMDIDNGVAAGSRNVSNETKRVILVGETADWVDTASSSAPRHRIAYVKTNVEDGIAVTESCSCGATHGTATLSYKDGMDSCFYTGNPVEFAEISYGAGWISGPAESLVYANNVNVGTATFTATINKETVSLDFEIVDRNGAITPNGDYDQSGTIDVSYTIDEAYTVTIPAAIELGQVGVKYGGRIKIEMVPDVQRVLKMTISSENGFKVVADDPYDAVDYCMFYTKDGRTIRYPEAPDKEKATSSEEILIAEVRWDDDDEGDDPGITVFESIAFARTGEPNRREGQYFDTLTYTLTTEYDDNTIPLVDGKEFDTTEFDLGDESKLYVKEQVADTYAEGVEVFNNYVDDFRKLGYSMYTTNKIDSNHYATLTSENKIINVMYIDYYKDIRVVVDQRSVFVLPGKEIENVYETWAEYSPNLTLIADIDGPSQDVLWPGRMGYIYQLDDGSFFIIDGGYGKEFSNGYYGSAIPAMEKVLMDYAPKDSKTGEVEEIKIAGWLITHMHEDHFGAFVDLSVRSEFAELKSKITIEKLIYSKDSYAAVIKKIDDARGDTSNEGYFAQFQEAVNSWDSKQLQGKVKAHPGQKFYLRNMEMTVYTSQDLLHGSEHYIEGDKYDPLMTGSSALKDSKYLNNTTITVMIEFQNKKALYMGDASAATNPYVTARIYDNALAEIQILQVAHHGYSDTAAGNVYRKIVAGGNLELIIWPAEAEHFYGSDAPSDYRVDTDVHNAFAVAFNRILFATDAKIYVHGQDNITIVDFETYETTGFSHPCQNYREYAK